MKISKRKLIKRLGVGALALSPWRLLFARSEVGYPRLMQGPMIGAVTESSALIWLRASGRFPVSVRYADNPQLVNAKISAPLDATPDNDYITKIKLEGLKAGQHYWYQAVVNGKAPRYQDGLPPFSFRTAPANDEPTRFRIAFGSCARLQEFPQQPIWEGIRAWNPDLFFWLGDNVYADTLEPDLFAETYQQQRAVTEFQPLGRSVPQLATWDDHDYGLNNHDHTSPIKDSALQIFNRYWANPTAGTNETPGVFFCYAYGGVDFFFLDNRFHRSPNGDPDGPNKTHLGAGQKAWLKRELKNSRAPFKLLITGGEWCSAKGEHGDSWSGYLHERNELFDFIRDENITGVVLMSGNIHRSELNALPWSKHGGYDFYDLCSSPLAQDTGMPDPGEQPELIIRPPYTGGPNAGVIDFDLTGVEPKLTYNVIDTSGRPVRHPLVLMAKELRNGQQSWANKIDKDLLKFYQ